MKVCPGRKRRVWLDESGKRDEEGFSVNVGKSNEEEDQHGCDNFVLHSKTCVLFLSKSSCYDAMHDATIT